MSYDPDIQEPSIQFPSTNPLTRHTSIEEMSVAQVQHDENWKREGFLALLLYNHLYQDIQQTLDWLGDQLRTAGCRFCHDSEAGWIGTTSHHALSKHDPTEAQHFNIHICSHPGSLGTSRVFLPCRWTGTKTLRLMTWDLSY